MDMRMKKVLILATIICFLLPNANAQRGVTYNHGTKSLSLGNVSSVLTGADAILNNFSAIDDDITFSAIASSERRFSISGFNTAIVGFQYKLADLGHIGAVFNTYGFEDYSENKFKIMYARKITSKMNLSVNFDYNSIRIVNFGSKSFLSFGLGVYGQFMDDLSYGVYLFSPEKLEIAEASEVPGYIQIGITKRFNQGLSAYLEVEKPIDFDPNIKLGIDYNVFNKVNLRIGYNTAPSAFGFGISYILNETLGLDLGSQYNTILGMTPSMTIYYRKSKYVQKDI